MGARHDPSGPDRLDRPVAGVPAAGDADQRCEGTHRAGQKPLTRVAFLFAHVRTADGAEGLGFSYSKPACGPGLYAHAREIAPALIGEDPSDIGRRWEKLAWAGASVGRGGLAVQAIAALYVALWDLKARRAVLPLAKLLGAYRDSVPCYNTSGGFLSSSLEEVLGNAHSHWPSASAASRSRSGIPISRWTSAGCRRCGRRSGPAVPLMVDANQQWTRAKALRICRILEAYDLTWIEEPLDAHDAEGHAALAAALDTPVATGEMLTSVAEHERMIFAGAADFIQPDVPRVGGITPFLKVLAMAEQRRLSVAPHFAMELHVHLAAAYPHEVWVEHFDWLEPLFKERLLVAGGKMTVPDRPGLGLTLSEQAAAWTADRTAIGPGAA